MKWPGSWLSIFIATVLHGYSDRLIPMRMLIADLGGVASDDSIYRIVHRMEKSGMVRRVAEGTTKAVKLTAQGRRDFEVFEKQLLELMR